VIELDRPQRAKRRGGAKSDPLDAVRAARRPSAVTSWPHPGPGRAAALSVRLAARRSAVEGSTGAQRQLHALVVMAPEALRARFRAKTTLQMIDVAANCGSTPVGPRDADDG